jgi:thermitase
MQRFPVSLIVTAVLIISSTVTLARAADQVYIAETKVTRSLTATTPPKLSPSLLAMRDAHGILKGSDDNGRPVISVSPPHFMAFSNSTSVRTVLAEAPRNWHPVKRLKLRYQLGNKPTAADLKTLGLTLIEDYAKGSFLVVEPLNQQIDAALASRLEASPQVQFVTPNMRVKAIPPSNIVSGVPPEASPGAPPTNDPMWPDLWGMRSIRADIAWKKVHDSPSVVVAVIDTGVDYTHEDLKDNIWSDTKGKHGFDFVDNDDDPMDQNSHGTHCAGTIGAVGNNGIGVVGVNWKIEIMAVRWLDAGGSGQVVNAIKAIDFAIDHGAKVLSNSWFWTEDDPDLEAAIQRANEAKVLFVSAAGNFATTANNNGGDNDNPSTFGRYPSAYKLDNIIAVAAINEKEEKADFSEFGKTTVHLGAPGVLILSTVPLNGYDGTFSGTSMATPHVAGAAALTMTANPTAGFLQVRSLLISNARKIPALKGRCVSEGTLDISFLNP